MQSISTRLIGQGAAVSLALVAISFSSAGAQTASDIAAGSAGASRTVPATAKDGPVTYTGAATPGERSRFSFNYPGSGPVSSTPVGRKHVRGQGADVIPASAPIPSRAPTPRRGITTYGRETAGAAVREASLPSLDEREGLVSEVIPKQTGPFTEVGLASWYGRAFHGRPTANGEIFDVDGMTAAHRTLPLPSLVQVINEENGREIVVRVNDRGPFVDDRVIDLSRRAAEVLDIVEQGEAPVRLRYLGPAPQEPTAYAARQDDELAGGFQQVSYETGPELPDLYGDDLSGGNAPSLGVADPDGTLARPATYRPTIAQNGARPMTLSLGAETRAAPVQAPAPAAASPSGNYFVQAGSFSQLENARRLNASLETRLPTKIEQARVDNADYFRVLIGPFDTRSAADSRKGQLSAYGVSGGFVVTR